MNSMSEQTHQHRREDISPSQPERVIIRRPSKRGLRKSNSSRRMSRPVRTSSRRRLSSEDCQGDDNSADIFQYAENRYCRSATTSAIPSGSTSTSTTGHSLRSQRSHRSDGSDNSMEEHDGLIIPSKAKERGDSLVTLSYADALVDALIDVDGSDDMSHDEARNFSAFSETENKPRKGYMWNMMRRQCKKLKKKAKKGAKNPSFLMAACLVITGLLIVIAAVGMTGGFKDGAEMDGYRYIQHVPVAPSGLASSCEHPSNTARDTLSVPATCQSSCNKAECCWNPNGNFECSADTKANCPAYVTPCSVMMQSEMQPQSGQVLEDLVSQYTPELEEMSVSAAPSGLMQACKRDENGNVSDYCKDQCGMADCCWNRKTQFTCTAETLHTCGVFKSICTFLNEQSFEQINRPPKPDNGLPFPDAPIGMDYFCDADRMGVNLGVCKDKCSQAECCWKDSVDSCVGTVPDNACKAYTDACSFWNDRDDNEDVQTSTAITASTTHTGSPQQTAPPTAAPQTTPAAASPQPNNSPATATMDVPAMPIGLLSSCEGDVSDECKTGCAAAECCWSKQATSICSATTVSNCGNYKEVCNFLNNQLPDTPPVSTTTPAASTTTTTAGNGIPQAPVDLAQNCALVSLFTPEGKAECQRHCSKAECCWAPEGNPDGIVPCTDNDVCNAYGPCSVLVGVGDNAGVSANTPSSGTGGGTPTGGSSSSTTPATASSNTEEDEPVAPADSDLASTCDVTSSGFRRSDCEDACRPALCCFDDTLDCDADMECSMYSPCGTLFRRRNLRASK